MIMIALYHQIKTSIIFSYRWELNSRSIIQPSKTLLVELTQTHYNLHFFYCTQDPETGNWWIVFGEDNIAVGYYPKDFVDVYGAASMAWEGYTISGSDGITPPLGSGHRPDHIHNHAAYYRDMRFIKDNLAEEIPRDDELTTHVDPNCHSIDDLHYAGSLKWGYIFFYGGPGGDCVGT